MSQPNPPMKSLDLQSEEWLKIQESLPVELDILKQTVTLQAILFIAMAKCDTVDQMKNVSQVFYWQNPDLADYVKSVEVLFNSSPTVEVS